MTVLTRLTHAGNYTLSAATDQAISANAAGGPFTLMLPDVTVALPTGAPDGTLFTIKKTDSSAYVVTIDAYASQTIDGSLQIYLTEYNQSVTLLSNGAGWEIR